MHRRLRLKMFISALLLSTLLPLAGCATSSARPFKWWPPRLAPSHIAQSTVSDVEESPVQSLSAAPAKLPPGIELPPEPMRPSETQPSAATEQEEDATKSSVIFAGFR